MKMMMFCTNTMKDGKILMYLSIWTAANYIDSEIVRNSLYIVIEVEYSRFAKEFDSRPRGNHYWNFWYRLMEYLEFCLVFLDLFELLEFDCHFWY